MAEITDFGPRKTIFILAIVAGCFAILWPKIFYPMLTASVTHHSTSDGPACCEVIFESDVTTVDIMQEMCQNILKHHQIDPRVRDALKTTKMTPQSASLCREEVLSRCGIDLSTFLAETERLGKSYKQVLEEIRSFNGSLCLKMNFGVPLSQLGTPHLIRYHILMPHSTIRQERRTPPHAGGLHPALRERGRAIPSSHIVPKVVDRADHVMPKMRPPLGGAGHVVAPPKGNGTMGIIMPLYTLGIVLFFLYTIVKVLKKNSDNDITPEYPGAAAEKEFRKMVFSPEALATAMTSSTTHYRKEQPATAHRPAPTIEELKDLVDGAPQSNGLAGVDHCFKEDSTVRHTINEEDIEVDRLEHSPTVKVMGMEMTASCEGGSRPSTPILPAPTSFSHPEREKTPPVPIYLEGALPPQCELLVTDSETQAQRVEEDTEAPVVLSGKMTLSLISLDQIAAESEDEQNFEGEDNIGYDESDSKIADDIKDENGNKQLEDEEDEDEEDNEDEEEEEEEEEEEDIDDDVMEISTMNEMENREQKTLNCKQEVQDTKRLMDDKEEMGVTEEDEDMEDEEYEIELEDEEESEEEEYEEEVEDEEVEIEGEDEDEDEDQDEVEDEDDKVENENEQEEVMLAEHDNHNKKLESRKLFYHYHEQSDEEFEDDEGQNVLSTYEHSKHEDENERR